MVIVLASLGVASVFIVTAISDFVDKVVVTTIDTTTASLQVRHLTRSPKKIKKTPAYIGSCESQIIIQGVLDIFD